MRTRHTFALAAMALVGACGFDDRVAGGTSSEVPNALHGKVVDSAGSPVVGAAVRIAASASWSDSLGQPDSTLTKADGSWSIRPRAIGTWTILVSGRGAASIREVTDSDTSTATDTLRAMSWVRGRVTGSGSNAASVSLLGTAITARANAQGEFVLGPLPSGALRLLVVGDSSGSAARREASLNLLPGDTGKLQPVSFRAWESENYGEWPSSRSARIDLTQAGAGIPGDHVGFPIPVSLDTILDVARTDPGSIRFDDGNGLHLPFQIDSWDSATGQALVWVRLDTANGSSDKHSLRIFWGKSDARIPSEMPPVFDAGNGFKACWHSGSSQETSMSNTLAWQGSTTAAGVVGDFQSLAGNGSYASDSVALGGGHSWTVSLWVKLDQKPSGEALLAGFADGPDSTRWGISVRDDQVVRAWSGADSSRPLIAPGPLRLGAWTHLVATFDATTSRIGLVVDSTALSRRTVAMPAGSRQRLRGGAGLHASFDEIRLSDGERASQWSALERQVSTAAIRWLKWD